MDLQEILANIDERTKSEIDDINVTEADYEQAPDGGGAAIEDTDVYQVSADARRNNSMKRYPNGSSQMVLRITQDAINGDDGREGLARAYRRARDDSESLRERGDRRRAEWVRQQYMEEKFLPVVEVVVNFTSPDELLNSKQALDALDKYVLSAGSGSGYTASYVRSAYGNQLGARPGISDPLVARSVRRIKAMGVEDNIRGAYGLAVKTKGQVDRGEAMASDEDYELLARVASFK